MGLFKRLFGDQPQGAPPPSPPPGGRGPPNFGLRRDTSGGARVDEAAMAAGPFPRSVRVRTVLSDYGLRGAWKDVSLTDAHSWGAAREDLIAQYYERFGLIHLRDGSKTIRWNEFTWRGIREALEFEHDPQSAGASP